MGEDWGTLGLELTDNQVVPLLLGTLGVLLEELLEIGAFSSLLEEHL